MALDSLTPEERDLFNYELENTSPKNAAITILFLSVARDLDREAAVKVRRVLRDQNLDPTSESFNYNDFLDRVEKAPLHPDDAAILQHA